MPMLYFFKLFCFIFASITAFNLYTELTHASISIWQVLIHAGLFMILLEFSFNSKLAPQSATTQPNARLEIEMQELSGSSTLYCHILSKMGLVSIFSSLVAQSLIS